MNISKALTKPPCPELRGSIEAMKYPAFVEQKIDGEFQYIIVLEGNKCCINKYGTVKTDFKALAELNPKYDCVLLGELYYLEGNAGQFYDMQANQDKSEDFKLAIFDVLMADNKDVRHMPLVGRKEVLCELGLYDLMPPMQVVETQDEVNKRFQEAVNLGAEGIVVKSLDSLLVFGPCSWVKMKKKDRNDYPVYHVNKTLERIEVLVPYVTGGANINVHVGVKACNRYKRYIKMGDIVTIEHQGVLASGSLRHPVLIPKKEWK